MTSSSKKQPCLSHQRLEAIADHLGDFAKEKNLLTENQELRDTISELLDNEKTHEKEASQLKNRIRSIEEEKTITEENAQFQLSQTKDEHDEKLKRIHGKLDALERKHKISPPNGRSDRRQSDCTLAEHKIREVDEFMNDRRDSFDEQLTGAKAAHTSDVAELQALLDRMADDEEDLSQQLQDKTTALEDEKVRNDIMQRERDSEREQTQSDLDNERMEKKQQLKDVKSGYERRLRDQRKNNDAELEKLRAALAQMKAERDESYANGCFHEEIERTQFVVDSLQRRQQRMNRAMKMIEENEL